MPWYRRISLLGWVTIGVVVFGSLMVIDERQNSTKTVRSGVSEPYRLHIPKSPCPDGTSAYCLSPGDASRTVCVTRWRVDPENLPGCTMLWFDRYNGPYQGLACGTYALVPGACK